MLFLLVQRYFSALSVLLIVSCNSLTESTPVINTGITWEHQQVCWMDDRHVVLLQTNRMTSLEHERPKGLYLLDLMNPTDLPRLDLSPLPQSIHEEIDVISCQDQTVLFYRNDSVSQMTETYAIRLGSPPELISNGRGWQVSLTGHYLLSSRPADPTQGTRSEDEECPVKYLKPGFIRHCWDFFFSGYVGHRWPLAQWVLAEYAWEDMLTIHTEGGRVKKKIPNPTQPLLGKDGKPLVYGLHLRDLSGKIVATLTGDKYRPLDYDFIITPDEKYLYAPCWDREELQKTDLPIKVCRYRLDGQQHAWEVVFRFNIGEHATAGISKISVTKNGNVYFFFAIPTAGSGRSPQSGVWRFDATSGKIDHLISQPLTSYRYTMPNIVHKGNWVSPDENWVMFVREGRGKEGPKIMVSQVGVR